MEKNIIFNKGALAEDVNTDGKRLTAAKKENYLRKLIKMMKM